MSEAKAGTDLEPSILDVINEQLHEWNGELRELLPTLPEEIEVSIQTIGPDNYNFYEEGGWDYGTDGSTPTSSTVILEVDTKSDIPHSKLLASAKATYYHENYHLARGYSFESTGLTLLDVAIEEGTATKFEIDRANSNPLYGHHQAREVMLAILDEVRNADSEADRNWQKWKFHYKGETPEQDRHWILYRLGTFIAEEALINNPNLVIQDLATLTCDEILKLAGLQHNA